MNLIKMKVLLVFKGKWMVLVGILFFLPVLEGCNYDELPDQVSTLEDANAFIVGEWEWKKSLIINGRQGNTIVQTPESEAVNKQYIFRRDRTTQYIENGTVLWNSEYEIEVNE